MYHFKRSLFFLVLGILLTTPVIAGNKKLMTIKAAKTVAERAIVESTVGLKIRSQMSVVDMVAQHYPVDSKTMAAIKGIEYEEAIYDSEKDIARVIATIRVGSIENIAGISSNYKDLVIRRVGFGTSTPESAGALKAMRAAEIDAYEQLARQIVGLKLKSETSVENFILKSDVVKTKVLAAIWGAELKEYWWDKEGDAHVSLTLKLGFVEDILGQKLNYQGKEVIEVEGTGAQVDDFSPAQSSQNSSTVSPKGTTLYKEGKLDVPVVSKPELKAVPEPIQETLEGGGSVNTK